MPVSPNDKIREGPNDQDGSTSPSSSPHSLTHPQRLTYKTVEPYTKKEFEDGQRELAKDLIVREQQIELLISSLPGLENTTEDQQKRIAELEEELKKEEAKRAEAVKEKDVMLQKLEEVIRSIRRP